MTYTEQEREERKKAIFDGMSPRGQKRILRIGYENWDPFQEPKDPRELIFSSSSVKATALVAEFYRLHGGQEESVALHKELFDLCRGLIGGESRARVIVDFCCWCKDKVERQA
jgi:hypothetical protein